MLVRVAPAVAVVVVAGPFIMQQAVEAKHGVDGGRVESSAGRVVNRMVQEVAVILDPVPDRAQVVGQRPLPIIVPRIRQTLDRLIHQELIDARAPQIPMRQMVARQPAAARLVELEDNLPGLPDVDRFREGDSPRRY